MRPQKFKGNVFVANLPKGYTDADLAQAFDPYGIVIAAFLARDPLTGAAKGHGLVSLAPDRAAAAAVEAINGTKIGGQKVEARIADPSMALTIPAPPSRDYSNRPERRDYSNQRNDDPDRPARKIRRGVRFLRHGRCAKYDRGECTEQRGCFHAHSSCRSPASHLKTARTASAAGNR